MLGVRRKCLTVHRSSTCMSRGNSAPTRRLTARSRMEAKLSGSRQYRRTNSPSSRFFRDLVFNPMSFSIRPTNLMLSLGRLEFTELGTIPRYDRSTFCFITRSTTASACSAPNNPSPVSRSIPSGAKIRLYALALTALFLRRLRFSPSSPSNGLARFAASSNRLSFARPRPSS